MTMPFSLFVDGELGVVWASSSVLKRMPEAAGKKPERGRGFARVRGGYFSSLLKELEGEVCNLRLQVGDASIDLVGRWLASGEGFLLMAAPDVVSLKSLDGLDFDDFSDMDSAMASLIYRDEYDSSLREAQATTRILNKKNEELERSKKELEKQRKAMLNMMRDVEESRSQLSEAYAELKWEVDERKKTEKYLELSRNMLEIANRHNQIEPMLGEFVEEIKNYTDCDSVGIRIINNEGSIPYRFSIGFNSNLHTSEEKGFFEKGSCICSRVLQRRNDYLAASESGSFCVGNLSEFMASLPDTERDSYRHLVEHGDFESTALIPIRMAEQSLGLIHIADQEKDMIGPGPP